MLKNKRVHLLHNTALIYVLKLILSINSNVSWLGFWLAKLVCHAAQLDAPLLLLQCMLPAILDTAAANAACDAMACVGRVAVCMPPGLLYMVNR